MYIMHMRIKVLFLTKLPTTDTTLEILHLQMHGAEMSV